MADLPHLFPANTARTELYQYARGGGGGSFETPPRDRAVHGPKLVADVQAAVAASAPAPSEPEVRGITLDFESDSGFKLQLQSLEIRQSGIELRNSRMEGEIMHGTVFVPDGKLGIFIKRFEEYATLDTNKGKPRHEQFAASIASVRRASLHSFWTDAGSFPEPPTQRRWWEVWLRDLAGAPDVAAEFRALAQAVNISVSARELRFPERRVVLAYASAEELGRLTPLFAILAELRLAKLLAGEFVKLAPRDQAEFVNEALTRIQPPAPDAPSVCHLDTGVNRAHPLLALALAQDHLLTADPAWSPADLKGHGTEMAGLALYGSLTTILGGREQLALSHRLESVKILPDGGQNDPDLYGEITSQAVSRIEIAAAQRQARVFCLPITADGRDQGLPSSWSAAVDQIASGAMEEGIPRRLMLISAGNIDPANRGEYPDRNQVEGIEDPAQAWNAVAIGAFTNMAEIRDPAFAAWRPVAPVGGLSPCSRTSLIWEDQHWPLKPDIVMEGGNSAIDPGTGLADSLDDLSLLTTRLDPTGALLTTTADTSAATALAARSAAIIWARYPRLWPETVRGLLVHSARWTPTMLKEFPYVDRRQRLRCYGYGVPDLPSALRSLRNSATLIVEGSLQPFDQVTTTDAEGHARKDIKAKDMHLHELPWPTAVLESLGATQVRMRVTLSYFIEPSPGRRGWKRPHRYQSHGLRFEVKRPAETNDAFHKRISKAARDEDEEKFSAGSDDRNWEVGYQLRSHGSIHSDTWAGTGAALAACGAIAIFPVTGWWRERPHLRGWERQARYSLLVTLETGQQSVDLYTPIAAQIVTPTVIAVETS